MNLLPLLNSTNRHRLSSESSKRKCPVLTQKAAPTCTLSLTSVSVSAHGSSDSLNFIPFPCPPTSISFPSEPIPIPTSTSGVSSASATTNNPPPRPRVRTQASLLRRKRSSAKPLVQSGISPSSSQVESPLEPDQVSPTLPPRKRARKASIASPSTQLQSRSPPPPFHSLSISSHPSSQRKNGGGKSSSKKTIADLRFLCSVYRSIAWLRLQRDFSEATRCLINAPDSMEVDIDPPCVSVLDAQDKLLMSRMRSYLIFNEVNSQWLDLTPVPPFWRPPVHQEVDVSMDMDVREELKSSSSPPTSSPQLQQRQQQQPPSMLNPDQMVASMMLRYRYRSKGKSRPEALPVSNGQEGRGTTTPVNAPIKMRKRSPLAAPEASWVPDGI